MISHYLIALVAVGLVEAGVLLPSKSGPAYSASVFSQTISRQHEPVQYLAQYAAPAAPVPTVQTIVDPCQAYLAQVGQLARLSTATLVDPCQAYYAQLRGVGQLTPVAPVAQYVAGYPPAGPPVQTVGYLKQAKEKKIKSHPKYEYAYLVIDPSTGDHKSQQETRNGDAVRGEYALIQPDGSLRRVAYTADDHSGFNAVIRNYAPVAIPYDPCQTLISGQAQQTSKSQPTVVNCDPIQLAAARAAATKGLESKSQTVDFSEQSRAVAAAKKESNQIPSSPLVETLTESGLSALKQSESSYGSGSTSNIPTPTAYSTTSVTRYDTKIKHGSNAKLEAVSLSYEDILRCAEEVARLRQSKITHGAIAVANEQRKEHQATQETELAVLPAARAAPAIAYVATPFLFPTNA